MKNPKRKLRGNVALALVPLLDDQWYSLLISICLCLAVWMLHQHRLPSHVFDFLLNLKQFFQGWVRSMYAKLLRLLAFLIDTRRVYIVSQIAECLGYFFVFAHKSVQRSNAKLRDAGESGVE